MGSTTKLRMPVTALFEDIALAQAPAVAGLEPSVQVVPDPAIGPVVEILFRSDLEIEAGHLG